MGDKSKFARSVFPKKKISKLFLAISEDKEFQVQVRNFLNQFNSDRGKEQLVFSFPAKSCVHGGVELQKPSQLSDFWIDFNLGNRSISLFHEKSADRELWLFKTFSKDAIKSITIKNTKKAVLVHLEHNQHSSGTVFELSSTGIEKVLNLLFPEKIMQNSEKTEMALKKTPKVSKSSRRSLNVQNSEKVEVTHKVSKSNRLMLNLNAISQVKKVMRNATKMEIDGSNLIDTPEGVTSTHHCRISLSKRKVELNLSRNTMSEEDIMSNLSEKDLKSNLSKEEPNLSMNTVQIHPSGEEIELSNSKSQRSKSEFQHSLEKADRESTSKEKFEADRRKGELKEYDSSRQKCVDLKANADSQKENAALINEEDERSLLKIGENLKGKGKSVNNEEFTAKGNPNLLEVSQNRKSEKCKKSPANRRKSLIVDVNSKISGGEQKNRKAESFKENLPINNNGRLGLIDKADDIASAQDIEATGPNSKQMNKNRTNTVEDCKTPVLRFDQSEKVAKTSNNNKEVVPELIKDWDTNENTASTKHQNDRKGSKRPSVRKSLFSNNKSLLMDDNVEIEKMSSNVSPTFEEVHQSKSCSGISGANKSVASTLFDDPQQRKFVLSLPENAKPTRFRGAIGKNNFNSLVPAKKSYSRAKTARKSLPNNPFNHTSKSIYDFDSVVSRDEGKRTSVQLSPAPASFITVADQAKPTKSRSRTAGKSKRKRACTLFSDSEQDSEIEDTVKTKDSSLGCSFQYKKRVRRAPPADISSDVADLGDRSPTKSLETRIQGPEISSGYNHGTELGVRILSGLLASLEGIAEMNIQDNKTKRIWKSIEKVAKQAT